MSSTPELWKATYEARTSEELAAAYKLWAPEYDTDTCQGMGYVGPAIAAQLLDRHLESRQSRILDAGCGTGLVGEHLRELGYERVEAMDYSEDMLRCAEQKNVYECVFQADMNQQLSIEPDSYDAVICVGTFTYAHVGPHAFGELTRITKPGGYVCFTIRDGAYQEYGYRDTMLDMEARRAWELATFQEEDYLRKEKVQAKFCTYRVLDA